MLNKVKDEVKIGIELLFRKLKMIDGNHLRATESKNYTESSPPLLFFSFELLARLFHFQISKLSNFQINSISDAA